MEDLFTSLRPVYYFAKASGIFLYKPVGTAGNRSFVVHKSVLIYCLVAILMCLSLVTDSFVKHSREMVLVVISSLQALTNTTLIVTNIVCNIYYTRTQVTLLNALVDFDRRANRFGIFINYKQSFRRILFRIVVELFMFTLFLCVYKSNEMPFYVKILWLVPYFTNKLVKMSVIIHFEAWIILFNERFIALYQNLLDVISNVNLALCGKEYLNHIVVETSDMHLTLSTIAGKVNRIYSIQLLMFVTLNFVLLLVMAYVLCCEIFLQTMTNSNFLTAVYYLFYNAMNMSITCVLCATLIKNVSRHFLQSLTSSCLSILAP